MQIQLEAVLDRGRVHLGDQAARARQSAAIYSGALCHGEQLLRCLSRVAPPATTHVHTELILNRSEPALERADHAGGDATGVPVHAHHGAEGLKPERVGQPREQLLRAVVMHDRLGDQPTQPRHALAQPGRHATAVQR
jgi:hypothetical protein